ncbi:MAG: hypothetical protein JNK79_20130 [Chitinophagaceae bacterium]|nr:hypothetical protein [Chitinophagaceae bacterium]
MKRLLPLLLLCIASASMSQVKIGDNPNTINSNSLLELESTTKGFLPPRIALNDKSSIAPLTGTVTAGMLVYSSGGTLADGYYYWNGTAWRLVETQGLNTVAKTANATLLKTETMVLASNDITLTLPAVTASDNGLEMTVKNVGSHEHLITVVANGSATIDEKANSKLTRYQGRTFVASGGNWVLKDKTQQVENLLDVNSNSSWTTIEEVVDFLNAHMAGPTVVRLGEETYDIASTININLPYSLTFQGLSYGTSTIAATSGIAGSPLFNCTSDCFFKMLQFDATTAGTYGTASGEDAIRFVGNGTYNEVKDCTFDRFYNTINVTSNAELWIFETDISNAQNNGILLNSTSAGVILKVAETDFIDCTRGVNLSKGSGATIQLASGGYYNGSGDIGISYDPANFLSFSNISITGNSWNNVGSFISGFDFTRSDGRDANATIENNAGLADQQPNCTFGVTNNSTTTTLSLSSTWYKLNWTNNNSTTTKWTINNNRITYQPTNRRNAYIIISGNIQVNSSSTTINVGLVKKPSTTSSSSITRYGETTLRPNTANQPFQFSIVVNLADIAPGDYFELWANASADSRTVIIQDIQWLVNTQ